MAQPSLTSISPVHLLPVELIAEILLLNSISLQSTKDQFDFPAIVSLVCRFWSSIVSETPKLWTSIYLPLKASANARVQNHLQKSKGCALNLEIAVAADDVWQEDRYRESLTSILPHCARWKALKLSTGTRVWAERALSMIPAKLSCLEELEIGANDDFGDGGKLNLSLDCPTLRELKIRDTGIVWDSCMLGGLRTMVVENDTWFMREFDGFLQVLSRSPDLERLDFNQICVNIPFSDAPDALRKVSLPNLRILNIDDYVNGHSVRTLLSHILIPNLESLTIKGAGYRCERWFEDIPAELPVLKSLSLERIVPMDRVAHTLVKKAPILESLSACNPHDMEKSTLGFLRQPPPSSGTTLCPRLSTLLVKNTWLSSIEDVARSRGGSLKSIYVHRLDTLVKDEADWVDETDHLLRARDLASWTWLKENTSMRVWGELSTREQKFLGDRRDIEDVISSNNAF